MGGFFHDELRTQRKGFPDLLRYTALLTRHVILGKGGELITTYRYRGPDMQVASDEELDFLRMRVNTLMTRLEPGWMLHTTMLREESVSYPDGGAFPDSVTRAIEAERRIQYRAEDTHYENDYYITFTYLPEPILVNKLKEFVIESDEQGRFDPKRLARKSLAYFEQKVAEYVGDLGIVLNALKMERLGARRYLDPDTKRRAWQDTQLSFLHRCITGIKQPIRIPDKTIPLGVDFIIGCYGFHTGRRPMINNQHIRVVAVEGLPDAGTSFSGLEVLSRLAVEYRWTTRWIAGDAEKQKAKYRKVRNQWRLKVRGLIAEVMKKTDGPVNKDAQDMVSDVEGALVDLESGAVAYGSWTSTVVLMHKDAAELDAAVEFLKKHVRSKGFPVRDEEDNCVEAYLGSLPGHGYENVRRPEIHSMNLADCLPLTSVWQGPTANPCSFYKALYQNGEAPVLLHGCAAGGIPFRLVLHVGQVGHTFIGGPTGAGKSTLLGLIAQAHRRYPNAKFYGFEKGESMMALCLGAGGTHYNFMDEDSGQVIGLAPFRHLQKASDRIWARGYVETILTLHGQEVDLDVQEQVRLAIDLLADRPLHMRTFTTLASLVQMRNVRQVLSMYETDMAGGMLNAVDDTVSANRFTLFEMEKLMEMNDKHVVPVLLYLFRMIERGLDGSPAIICLDEAWLMLNHPMFEEKIKEWLKVLRKANCLVIFATQEIEDVANSTIASTIFQACQTKILLPNKDAERADSAKMYRTLGLTDREIFLLKNATPQREYFFVNPDGRRMFQLELGPVALAFVGASGVADRAMVKSLYKEYGGEWIIHWAKHQGLEPGIFKTGAAAMAEALAA